jgi:hypothetical protein
MRVRVDYIQTYLVASVQRAFGELTGLMLGDQPSSAIEDLRELDRIDEAFQRLAEVSSRQDRAAFVVGNILAQLVLQREFSGRCGFLLGKRPSCVTQRLSFPMPCATKVTL